MNLPRRFISILLASLMIAPSATALSCAMPDIMRELNEVKASEKIYHIFIGRFSAPKVKLASPGGTTHVFPRRARSQTVQGRFTGYSLASQKDEDVALLDYPVQINVTCAASWCGQVPRADQEMIAFVEALDRQPPILHAGPCPYLSHAYTAEKTRKLRECLDIDCDPGNPW